MSSSSDDQVASFLAITGTSDPEAAQFYLDANKGDLNEALASFLEGNEASVQRTAPSSRPAASSSSKTTAKRATGSVSTLGSIAKHGSDDDESDDEKPAEFYTGGEKSGLGVLDPNSKKKDRSAQGLIEQIMRKAQQGGAPPNEDDDASGASRFKGAGYTLGSDEADSTKVEDPNEVFRRSMAHVPPRVKRTLKLWQDGFSVDDGPLFRFDDPANKEYLEAINQGHAPLSLLNVAFGQPVDVEVQKSDDNYSPPPKIHKPFDGQGHRLGSEIPPAAGNASVALQQSASQSSSANAQPSMDVDASLPQTQLNIRLAAGGRLVSAFNTTHTVDDVYGLVDRASDAAGHAYVLLTPFPRREYQRGSKDTLEAAGLLKGTLQQKFL
ncbi:hypothetical protein BCR37DRAFT_370310 [Protomyces lactucae-debilis]|uniref:Uncharacterized protein n=1 Tax=Protomyces lactucae-debilis TaxID=2754530 RepID=A0A1Y2F528_PROLT|nr:uncharacterized protein BCR37DRAFT_370310 [Protomyces lactucae-debilis]ORY79028.1 hypothetical protein BCR37DRAFT_370310 [Protomyces lactucae-debilis]